MTWISVKDKLPEKGQMIVYCCGHEIMSATGRYCGIDDPMPSMPLWMNQSSITHWMPIPKLPELPIVPSEPDPALI